VRGSGEEEGKRDRGGLCQPDAGDERVEACGSRAGSAKSEARRESVRRPVLVWIFFPYFKLFLIIFQEIN
jgi:hypothetical protein